MAYQGVRPSSDALVRSNETAHLAKAVVVARAGPPAIPAPAHPCLVFSALFLKDVPMNLEHLGLNHHDPVAAAAWYCQHLGMTVARKLGAPGHGHFLADAQGKMMLEFYFNAKAGVPDYAAIDPFAFHIAFQVDDVTAVRTRLLRAGATPEGDVNVNADGDQLTIVRDPWGVSLQLVKRTTPML